MGYFCIEKSIGDKIIIDMYIDFEWIIFWAIILGSIVYNIGFKNGYSKYHNEIDAMERRGEVVFPKRDLYDDDDI